VREESRKEKGEEKREKRKEEGKEKRKGKNGIFFLFFFPSLLLFWIFFQIWKFLERKIR
jgi:hypothetical protein